MKNLIHIFLLFITISCYKETAIQIEPEFRFEYKNQDKSAPVIIQIKNLTKGADSFEWTFSGAEVTNSNQENPSEIVYNRPGNYTLKMIAKNRDGIEQILEKNFVVFPAINIEYSTKIIKSNFSPVEIMINNTTKEENLTYNWTFEGGIPSEFNGKNPPNIIFSQTGKHKINVKVSTEFESFEKSSEIEVLPQRISDFDWEVDFLDIDYQAPVTLFLKNKSISSTSYNWEIQGGNPTNSTLKEPVITFQNDGTFNIKLTSNNDKGSSSITKRVTILPDTNLKIYENIKFGINSAHNNNSVGSLFESTTGKIFSDFSTPKDENHFVDIAFFSLNSDFNFNKFVSPTDLKNYGFSVLKNPKKTIYINSQEICKCGNFSFNQFMNMKNDIPLRNLSIIESITASQEFNENIKNRVILFKTQDNRKGAILIKDFIKNGQNSYILTDIKLQKLAK